MQTSLPEMLGLPSDSRPLEVARAVELQEITLRYRAKQGCEEASRAMLELRLAYLDWAYCSRRKVLPAGSLQSHVIA